MGNENLNKKISLIINIIIFLLTIVASVIMFTGFKFMKGHEIILEGTKIGMFKFFTVDSNIFMGISALIFGLKEIKVINDSQTNMDKKYFIMKLMATSSVSLTFFVVFAYLGPISKGGILTMLMNSNLFFHLIIPVLSIITFTIFEKTDKIKIRDTIYGIIPTILYFIYYISNVLSHIKNGKVSTEYDWYWFVQNGIWTAFIVAPLILLISYGISFLLWKANKK